MMKEFKNITVKMSADFNTIAPILWCYPIQYNSDKYLVKIAAKPSVSMDYLKVDVYKYREKYNILFGHEGKHIFEGVYSYVKIEDEKEIVVSTCTFEELFPQHLILFLHQVFASYEDACIKREEKEKSLLSVYEWNGIIEDASDNNTQGILPVNGEYVIWLENMLTMVCGQYKALIDASSEDILATVPLPRQDETRRAIRLISENAHPTHEDIGEHTMEHFAHILIEKQRYKNNT